MAGLTIDRAIVHNASDAAGARARLAAALDPVTLAAVGIPERATLVVARMAMRGRMPQQGDATGFAAELRDGLRARLAAAGRGTARTGSADWLFEDAAALEAAIVADWLDRPLATGRAWWIAAVGTASPPERWRRRIFSDASLLPRTLALLEDTGHAARWLARFDPVELTVAAQRLLGNFGSSLPVRAAPALPLPIHAPRLAIAAKTSAPLRQIQAIAPEALEFVIVEARVLMAVALTIARRPAVVATPEFARALAAVLQPSAACDADLPYAAPEATSAPLPLARFEAQTARRIEPRSKPLGSNALATAAAKEPAQAPRPVTALPFAPLHPAPPAGVPIRPAIVPLSDVAGTVRPVIPVRTDFGGLLFLLNAFVALGLYGDATRPADGLRGLSPFELLVLLGDRWFGAAFRADPLRTMLINLSGLKSHDRLGRDFAAPRWSVPKDWMLPWPAAATVRRGAVRWHPARFPLNDQPIAPRSPATQRRHWIDCLARYLSARLRQTLGIPDAVAVTCRIPAQLTSEGDRLESQFVLDSHPITLRLAGLDRDPGWMPMAGRHISFVFA